MNKNTKAKQYVVKTYTGWTEPQTEVLILTLEEIENIKPYVGEIEAIYELGKEVKLKMVVA